MENNAYFNCIQGINSMDNEFTTPRLVSFFVGKADIQDVHGGSGFCVVLLQDGSLYAMGHRNRCGIQTTSDCYVPVLVHFGAKVESIACCAHACTIVRTYNNEWFAFGETNEDTGQKKPAVGMTLCETATRIDHLFPQVSSIVKMVATAQAFFLLCDNGNLYVIGNGASGVFGLNNDHNVDVWTMCKTNVADVQTGLRNSFVFEW